MYQSTDEVVLRVFAKPNKAPILHEELVDFLLSFDGKAVRTLSGKEVSVHVHRRYDDLRIEAGSLTIYVADCEFELFCTSFPYNEHLVYDDLLALIEDDTVFYRGKMSPKKVLAHPVGSRGLAQLDLFYGMVLNRR